MANTYKKIDCSSSSNTIQGLKNALVDKFGDLITIHYCEGEYLIFDCPSVSSKTIKISRYGFYYGSSYKDGYEIYDEVQFCLDNKSTWLISELHLVLSESFIFMAGLYNGSYRFNSIIAKTEGGLSIVHGSYSDSGKSGLNMSVDVTNGLNFMFVEIGTNIGCGTNIPYKTKLMMSYITATGDTLVRKADGTPDTIPGLYMSTFCSYGSYNFIAAPNALFSNRGVYANSIQYDIRTSIVAEF